MNTPWIRAKDIPDFYSLSRWKGYELTRLFRAQADRDDYIADGKMPSLTIPKALWSSSGTGSARPAPGGPWN